MATAVPLGARLRYPITIIKLFKKPGDTVKKREPVMQYSFKWMTEVGDPFTDDGTWEEEQTTITDWDSPSEGELKEWRIKPGEVIHRNMPCFTIKEACGHEVQFAGICAICGKDLTEVNWASETRDTERATVNMTHDETLLTVSKNEAQRIEHESQERLLQQRKLSLVVDLDQTIIHACIDPTVGEWQRDPNNPNHEAVKDVRSFQLNDEIPRGLAASCWYYIKMRPGLEDFLSKISELYELHVYTMGTRAYALNIAKIVDPQKKLFGNRVISRDENGSLTMKSLQRLFPASTNMVVIMDDRADVWPRNRPNLIKVTPYDFFKGVGDINSSFLPKRQDQMPRPEPTEKTSAPQANGTPTAASVDATNAAALEDLVRMGGGDDPLIQKKQMEEQERTLEKQIKDRPLQQLQAQLEKGEEEPDNQTTNGEEPAAPAPQPRHNLLLDDDQELVYLQDHLTNLHHAFFEQYDEEQARKSHTIPDVGNVLGTLKSNVLDGTVIVMSGIIPIGMEVMRSEIGMQAASFGARVETKISRRVTHLVVSPNRPRTQKVRQAARIPTIKIVNQGWLSECLTKWAWVDETPYLIDVHPADRGEATQSAQLNENAEVEEVVSDADDDNETPAPLPARILRLKNPSVQVTNEDGQAQLNVTDDTDFDSEDVRDEDDDLIPPELQDGELSPVDDLKTFDWGEADEELKEFLGSDDEDEGDDDAEEGEDGDKDNEQDADEGTAPGSSRKRKLDDDAGTTDSETGDSRRTLSAKKQRMSPTSAPDSNDLPTPAVTGDEDDIALLNGDVDVDGDSQQLNGGDPEDQDGFGDDLEADLMAEFEAEERQERESRESEKG